MYTHYFGFKERPFKLVPNPEYLYLSQSHEEALAHLTYAVSEGDGFLTITGEVGTGKTTLCRSFIERLDSNTVVAYIFNPKLDAVQLLKSINDEFEINSDFDNTKDLIDTLNRFLIDKKKNGKQVVLLIDEAQNLTVDVLEQLRLLSNLETTKEKLLQIILVGQPELFELLDSQELRQLAQRITLRRHLLPLNSREVKEYVTHRITHATQKSQIKFTGGAFRSINNYSHGIPRLINIVCDRSLLTAYGRNQKRITGAIVKSAIRELTVSGGAVPSGFLETFKIPILLSILLLVVILLGIFHPNDIFNIRPLRSSEKAISITVTPEAKPSIKAELAADTPLAEGLEISAQPKSIAPEENIPEISNSDAADIPMETPVETPIDSEVRDLPLLENSKPSEDPTTLTALVSKPVNTEEQNPVDIKPLSFKDYIDAIDINTSREKSLEVILDLWGIPHPLNANSSEIADDSQFFLLTAQQNGLSVQTIKNNFSLVMRLNLPFILEIYWPEKLAQVYLAVYRVDQNRIYIKTGSGDRGIVIDQEELGPHLGENAYILWKNFYGYTGIIPTSTSENNLITLKLHIREMGFPKTDINPYYDQNTRDVVKNIQKKYQIAADGLVGPITKIALYNETPSLPIPHLNLN